MTLNAGFIPELVDFLDKEPRTARMVQHQLQKLGRPFLMRSDLQETFAAVRADRRQLRPGRVTPGAGFRLGPGSGPGQGGHVCRPAHQRGAVVLPDVPSHPSRGDGDLDGRVPGLQGTAGQREAPGGRVGARSGPGAVFPRVHQDAGGALHRPGGGFHEPQPFEFAVRQARQEHVRNCSNSCRCTDTENKQLMLSPGISDVDALAFSAAPRGRSSGRDPRRKHPGSSSIPNCIGLGFELGWGRDAGRVRETMQLLLDVLEAPSPDGLERFLARVPMLFSICILSPHGWFGQDDVLGRPDTGGQVVYILDQVRALEQEMTQTAGRAGARRRPADPGGHPVDSRGRGHDLRPEDRADRGHRTRPDPEGALP